MASTASPSRAAATGKCRVLVHEEWPTGWVENSPATQWLKDNKRFIWTSERTGYRNFFLYDVSGKLIVDSLLRLDRCSPVAYLPRLSSVVDYLGELAEPGDLILTLGAGDVHRVGERYLASN